MKRKRSYARQTRQALSILGKLIRIGRMERGMTAQELADRAGISRTTLYDWISAPDKAEFKAIIQTGVQLAEAWWDRQGREGLTREGFNARLWEINMRNRYAWLGFGDGQLEGIAALRARHRSEVESVRETVDVAAIIRAFEQKKSG